MLLFYGRRVNKANGVSSAADLSFSAPLVGGLLSADNPPSNQLLIKLHQSNLLVNGQETED